MFMFLHQNAGHHNVLTANKSLENVAEFKCLEMVATNLNYIHEIKIILNLGNACYHSVQNILSSF
jgi:hypothetical protein